MRWLARFLLFRMRFVEISKQLSCAFTAAAGSAVGFNSQCSILRESAVGSQQYAIHRQATTRGHGGRRPGCEQPFQRSVS